MKFRLHDDGNTVVDVQVVGCDGDKAVLMWGDSTYEMARIESVNGRLLTNRQGSSDQYEFVHGKGTSTHVHLLLCEGFRKCKVAMLIDKGGKKSHCLYDGTYIYPSSPASVAKT